jgi:hypothetical protein
MLNITEEEDVNKLSILDEQIKDHPNNDPNRDLEKNEPSYIQQEDNIINIYLSSINYVYNQIKNEIVNPTSYLRQNTTQIKNRVISWFGIKEQNKNY